MNWWTRLLNWMWGNPPVLPGSWEALKNEVKENDPLAATVDPEHPLYHEMFYPEWPKSDYKLTIYPFKVWSEEEMPSKPPRKPAKPKAKKAVGGGSKRRKPRTARPVKPQKVSAPKGTSSRTKTRSSTVKNHRTKNRE